MDFTKFVWLLATQSLFFARADLCEEGFEGSMDLVRIFPVVRLKENSA